MSAKTHHTSRTAKPTAGHRVNFHFLPAEGKSEQRKSGVEADIRLAQEMLRRTAESMRNLADVLGSTLAAYENERRMALAKPKATPKPKA